VVSTSNDLSLRVAAYLGNPANNPNTIAVDLAPLFALASDPGALVDQVDHDLLYGSMSAATRTTLVTLVGLVPYSVAAPQPRVQALLQVVLASPDFAIQK
jgi:hypothetical protein